MDEIIRLILLASSCVAAFLTGGIIDSILREANSKTAIKKISAAAPKWKKHTKICYWNTKSRRPNMLHFFIILRMIICAIPLYSLIPLRYEGFVLDMAAWLLYILGTTIVFDMIYFQHVLK